MHVPTTYMQSNELRWLRGFKVPQDIIFKTYKNSHTEHTSITPDGGPHSGAYKTTQTLLKKQWHLFCVATGTFKNAKITPRDRSKIMDPHL